MRRFAITLLLGCTLSTAAWGQDKVAAPPSGDVERLPAFKVSEPRAGDFLIHYGPIERNTGGPISFREVRYSGPTRMWLTQWPQPKGIQRVRFPPDTVMWINAAYRGRGLKSGDEIVRISGRLLTEMKPGECVRLFFDTVRDPDKLSVEIEVRAEGEKGTRKVIITKAPFNEVIVTKKPVELLTPFPLPEPIPILPESRAK